MSFKLCQDITPEARPLTCMLQPGHISVSPLCLMQRKDGLVSQALRYPCDPEDKMMPGHPLGMHSPILVVPVPWVQLLEQEQPLKNPNEMPIKAHCIHPAPEQPLQGPRQCSPVTAFILSPVAQGVYLLSTTNASLTPVPLQRMSS